MSLANFIQTVFIANILKALEKVHVFADVANQNYAGNITNLGDKVRIPMISDPTIKSFTKNTNLADPEAISDAVTELVVNQSGYFNTQVDDSEANQLNLITELQNKAAYKIRDTIDVFMAGLYAQAGLTKGTAAEPIAITSLNVEDVLAEIAEQMYEANIPAEGRFCIAPPWLHTKLWQAGLTTKTQNDAMYSNGLIGNVAGFDIRMSTNVSKNSSAWDQSRILFGIKGQSLSVVLKIKSVENYRPQNRFAEAVKGLFFYGGKIIRPDMTLCLIADKTAEEE